MSTQRTPSRPDPLADPDGIVTTASQLQARASTVLLVKDIADKLERLYPGWLWAVQPDERGGVINIFSMRLSMRWGYRLHTKNVQQDPHRRDAMRAGGEILDRFGMPRGRYDRSKWQAAKRYIGSVAMDISDRSQQEQRRYRDDEFTRAVRSGEIELKVKDYKTATGTHRELYINPSALWEKRDARTH